MGRPVKIAAIGAGSAVFSLGLVTDVCLTPNLASSLIAFMDVDPDRLDMIHLLALPSNREMAVHYR